MKTLLFWILSAFSIPKEMAITKEYTEYLKSHVNWEVVEYEDNIYKGWTREEIKQSLNHIQMKDLEGIEVMIPKQNLPTTINWAHSQCDYGVKNFGKCKADWAFAVADMISTRCCIQGNDNGWLSSQELISCDEKNTRCNFGWLFYALDYVINNKGLVPENCFKYKNRNVPCPHICDNGDEWADAHVCNCEKYKICNTTDGVKTCLLNGPIVSHINYCEDFNYYKSGIYKCNCENNYIGSFDALIVGYNYAPSCHFIVKYSNGTNWGVEGYANIACDSCGIGKGANTLACENVG